MRTTLTTALLALNGFTATALPVEYHRYHDANTGAVPTTLHTIYDHGRSIPVMTDTEKIGPHFQDWLAKTHSEQRDDKHWSERARKMIKAWSTFYSIEYPSKTSYKPISFDSDNDHSIPDQTLHAGEKACGIIVRNFPDGESPSTTKSIPCPAIHSSNNRPPRPSYFEQLRRNLATMDIALLCSRYGPELVALCIFLLVPISVMLVEIADVLHDRMLTEQFPERGRGRVRLTGPERRLSVIARCEREKIVRAQAQKSWVGSRRGSRH